MHLNLLIFVVTLFAAIIFLFRLFRTTKKSKKQPKVSEKVSAHDALIKDGMLHLMAALLLLSKNNIDNKIEFGKAMISKNFGEEKAQLMIQKLKLLMDEDTNVEDTCRSLRLSTSYLMRENLTQLLFRFACSDGEISTKELVLLQLISNQLAITERDYGRIKRLYIKAKLTDFALLGIEPTSDKRKVKAAYRKLAKMYHPDKLINATEQEKKESSARFRKIQEAYNRIQKS